MDTTKNTIAEGIRNYITSEMAWISEGIEQIKDEDIPQFILQKMNLPELHTKEYCIAYYDFMSHHLSDFSQLNRRTNQELIYSTFRDIERSLGQIVAQEYGREVLAWQVNLMAKPSDELLDAMLCFVIKKGVWCLKNYPNACSSEMFNLMPFDGHDLILQRESGKEIGLRDALDRFASHDCLVRWLANSANWRRWPDFLYERITGPRHRISRSELASRLGLRGLFVKTRVVKLIRKEMEQQALLLQ